MTDTRVHLAGRDYIGVGVGAAILNDRQEVLLSLRGSQARNERGKWEIPGGKVEWGETFEQAIVREVKEELGIEIEVIELLGLFDHILPDEKQHWVSPTFICKIISGEPCVLEPEKCEQVGWFSLEAAQKLPLSMITKQDISKLESQLAADTCHCGCGC